MGGCIDKRDGDRILVNISAGGLRVESRAVLDTGKWGHIIHLDCELPTYLTTP